MPRFHVVAELATALLHPTIQTALMDVAVTRLAVSLRESELCIGRSVFSRNLPVAEIARNRKMASLEWIFRCGVLLYRKSRGNKACNRMALFAGNSAGTTCELPAMFVHVAVGTVFEFQWIGHPPAGVALDTLDSRMPAAQRISGKIVVVRFPADEIRPPADLVALRTKLLVFAPVRIRVARGAVRVAASETINRLLPPIFRLLDSVCDCSLPSIPPRMAFCAGDIFVFAGQRIGR